MGLLAQVCAAVCFFFIHSVVGSRFRHVQCQRDEKLLLHVTRLRAFDSFARLICIVKSNVYNISLLYAKARITVGGQ